jgi:hypothetical protein
MLISGVGVCFAQPPALGRRSTAGGDWLSFQFAGQREPHSQSAKKPARRNGSLQNASKCSETFRNALARMTYCLGHPAIAASNGPVGNQHPFSKSMQSSA